MNGFFKSLKNNTALKIFSLVLAVLLWAYVQIAQNPEISYDIFEVPITITGEADINSEGFVVSAPPKNLKANVTVSARRSKIHTLDPSDLSAYVDASQCNATGDFMLPVKVRSNDSEITVVSKSPANISLYIDRVVTVQKPIRILYDGTLDSSCYIDKENINITPRTMTIKVPELEAANIAEILVSIDMTNNTKTFTQSFVGVPIDAKGEEIVSKKVSFVTEKVSVTVPVLKKKVLPITIKNVPPDLKFSLNTEQIEVAGDEDTIKSLTEISGYLENFSADDIKASYKVTLKTDGLIIINQEDYQKLNAYIVKDEPLQ